MNAQGHEVTPFWRDYPPLGRISVYECVLCSAIGPSSLFTSTRCEGVCQT